MKNTKKGFTLVELLVVIAILAILATVSVISYTSYIKEANKSNDTVIAAELNTILAATNITDPIENFGDVKNALYENGFYLANLNTKAEGCYFVWDAANNQIILVDGNDGFKVLYSKVTPSSNREDWKFVVSDITKATEIQAAGYTVEKIVTDFATLKEALATGGEFHVDRSLVLDKDNYFYIDGSTVTIHMGSSTLSTNGSISNYPILVKNGGQLTINGGVISAAGKSTNVHGEPFTCPIYAKSGTYIKLNGTVFNINDGAGRPVFSGKADLENVTFVSEGTGLEALEDADVTLVDCYIKADGTAFWICNNEWTDDTKTATAHTGDSKVTIVSGTYEGGNSKYGVIVSCGGDLVIEGGTFISNGSELITVLRSDGEITINGGTFNMDPTEYVNTDTHTVTEDNGMWTVVAK